MLISILGVDGVGKSSLLEEMNGLRVPQYHMTHRTRYDAVSTALENLSQWCDQNKATELKTLCLFLAMTLYGPVVKETGARVTERHPVLDSLAYAEFYSKVLSSSQGSSNIEQVLARFPKEWTLPILTWFEEWKKNIGATFSLSELPNFLLAHFATPEKNPVPQIQNLFQCPLPDVVIHLVAAPEALKQRLAQKNQAREAHEEIGILLRLQDLLRLQIQTLKAHSLSLRHIEVDTTFLNQGQTRQRVSQFLESSI